MVDPFAAIRIVSLVLQMDGTGVDVVVTNPVTSVLGGALGAFVTTLVVGAILVGVAPAYTEGKMRTLRENPVGSFLYGIVVVVFFVLVAIVLVFSFVGIPVAILLGLAAYVAWAVGSAIAFLAIGEGLVGSEDGWTKPLVVAAAISGGLTLTGLGGIVALCIGAAGFGAVTRDYLG